MKLLATAVGLTLLEAGCLAIFLTAGSRIVVWLYRWLVSAFCSSLAP